MSGYHCAECGHGQDYSNGPKQLVQVDLNWYCNEPGCLPLALIAGLENPKDNGVYKISGAYPSSRDGVAYRIRHFVPAPSDDVAAYFARLPEMLKRADFGMLKYASERVSAAIRLLIAGVGSS